MKIKKNKEDIILDTVIYTVMILLILITLYPFYLIIVKSFNEGIDSSVGNLFFWPRRFTLDNYIAFFTKAEWINALFVTIARTVIGSFLGVFFTCLVAYGLSYEKLLFKKVYFKIVIFAMYFSGGLIPNYILLRSLGLLDTFGVYIIPTMLSPFFLMIAISFFRDIPQALIESARLDGANDLIVYIKIVLPVSMPLLAAMLLFMGVNQWNAWVDSAYYIRSDELRTISYRMMEVINQSKITASSQAMEYAKNAATTTPESLQMAAIVISTLPIVCVYPFLQKYFIKGIMIGAVKG